MDGFNTVEENGLTLIFPKRNKFNWTDEEKKYRSVVLNNNIVVKHMEKF